MLGRITLLAFAGITAILTGCASVPPPPPPLPPSDPLLVEPPDAPPDTTPRVVRRLVNESRQQLEKNRQMADELQDPRGRERAKAEHNTLEAELTILAARVDNPDSDNLDDVMNRLQLLDTRIDLFHEKLRAATERSTALQKD